MTDQITIDDDYAHLREGSKQNENKDKMQTSQYKRIKLNETKWNDENNNGDTEPMDISNDSEL